MLLFTAADETERGPRKAKDETTEDDFDAILQEDAGEHVQQCLCFIHYFNHAYIPLTYSLVVAVPDLNMFVPGMCVAPSGDLLTSVELCIKPALLIMMSAITEL